MVSIVHTHENYYSPFGMVTPGRSFSAGDGYRFGFQSQEVDKEAWNSVTNYKYRLEDPRIGRFMSVDPLSNQYSHNSPYAFSENKVIQYVELEGLEAAGPPVNFSGVVQSLWHDAGISNTSDLEVVTETVARKNAKNYGRVLINMMPVEEVVVLGGASLVISTRTAMVASRTARLSKVARAMKGADEISDVAKISKVTPTAGTPGLTSNSNKLIDVSEFVAKKNAEATANKSLGNIRWSVDGNPIGTQGADVHNMKLAGTYKGWDDANIKLGANNPVFDAISPDGSAIVSFKSTSARQFPFASIENNINELANLTGDYSNSKKVLDITVPTGYYEIEGIRTHFQGLDVIKSGAVEFRISEANPSKLYGSKVQIEYKQSN